jgi:hypothetical protein
MMQMHARPHLMPTFVDNHDVDRFLAGGNEAGLKQALLALMTLPGIPVIYYGTEQGFTEQRGAMFAAGFASGGRDRYDVQAPLYRAIAGMSALRRSHKLFTRGTPTVLAGQGDEPGVLAWRMAYRGQTALVVFNTADDEAVRPQLATGLPAGTVLSGWFGLDGKPTPLVVGAGGRLTLNLPPRSGQVWRVTARRAVPPPEPRAAANPGEPNLAEGSAVWQLRADVADPAGDDAGPSGQYRYPGDAGWGDNRQMDLRRVRVSEARGALQLDLEMASITTAWNPANGFDHVVFTVFIELPGSSGGATVMPLQNAGLPAGMRWHRRLRVGGWSNALFSPAGASASHEGTTVRPSASIQVNRQERSIRLTLPASALGRLPNLSGAKVYVTTWDYDGGYRALSPQGDAYGLAGGAADGAKVMDDSAVIELP